MTARPEKNRGGRPRSPWKVEHRYVDRGTALASLPSEQRWLAIRARAEVRRLREEER